MREIKGDFQLGEWKVEPGLLRLRQGDETRTVGAKVMGVLQCLAACAGEPVSKDELVARAWEGDAASDEALTAVVYELRRALGDDARKPRFIATIRGRGYRLLVSPIAVLSPASKIPSIEEATAETAPVAIDAPISTRLDALPAPTAEALDAPADLSPPPFLGREARGDSRQLERLAILLAAMVVMVVGLLWSAREFSSLSDHKDRVDGAWRTVSEGTVSERTNSEQAASGQAVSEQAWSAQAFSEQALSVSSAQGTAPGRPSSERGTNAARQRLTSPSGDAEIRSVAVLEMEPRGMDRSVQPSLFARGLSEHLAIDLARSGWLEVVPAFSRALPADSEILSSRQVDAVVEGAVRQEGRRLLVTVQLIAADGQLLWGGSWERPADDLPSLEVELAGEISQRLRGRLGTTLALAQSPEVDEALRLGRHFLDADAPLEAQRYFSFALERQPTLASAHVGMAEALLASAGDEPVSRRESVVDQAREAVQTALEIDADLPTAHASLGTIALVHDGDLGAAGAHFGRASLDRGAPTSSLRGYSAFLSASGRHEESIGLLRQALIRSPASVESRLDLARALYLGERYEHALDELARVAELAPLDARIARLRSEILLVQGEHAAAVEACRQAVALAGGPEHVTELIDEVFERLGLAGVVRCLRDFEGERATGLYEPLHLARIEAVRGDAEAALDLIRLAGEQEAPGLVWLAVDPAFAQLHELEVFEELLAARSES